MSEPIRGFTGSYSWLSNFHPVAIFLHDGMYPTVEHAYQASKTFDPDDRRRIKNAHTPGQAKRMGRGIYLQHDWEKIKHSVMLGLIRQKFREAEFGLYNQLLATGDAEIIEDNTWGDTYWGVCKGVGENHLGKIIMQVRKEIGGK